MLKDECKKYDSCNAPLCPYDSESIESGCWYPDEEICTKKKFDWIKMQNKII